MPGRILIVEDDPDSRDILQMVLEQQNYEIVAVESWQTANIAMRFTTYDVVLLDVELSNENTLDMLRELGPAMQAAGTNIIVMSADQKYRHAIEELNIDFFLEKPVDALEVAMLVQRLM